MEATDSTVCALWVGEALKAPLWDTDHRDRRAQSRKAMQESKSTALQCHVVGASCCSNQEGR